MLNRHPAPRRLLRRLRQIARELDYAQRRTLELRTGLPVLRPDQRPGRITRFDELEFLFDYDGVKPRGSGRARGARSGAPRGSSC